LEVLNFRVELFFVRSVRRGRSARGWRTVREHAVHRVFFVFLIAFVFDLLCFRVLVGLGFGRSACAGRTVCGCLADSQRAPRGRSVIQGCYWRFCLLFRTVRDSGPDGPRCRCGQSAAAGRSVRVACADSPPLLAGRSARAWLLCSFVRFLPPSFVLPRVLQGIIPKTWRLVCDSIHRSCVTEICLRYRSVSLRRMFTGSYSLLPSLVAI
jgi:hypothetical protein